MNEQDLIECITSVLEQTERRPEDKIWKPIDGGVALFLLREKLMEKKDQNEKK